MPSLEPPDGALAFAAIIDQLRRSLALQYLKEPDMSLSQIAWLLGYEGSTSFNHAFRRQTERSASAARRQSTSPATSDPSQGSLHPMVRAQMACRSRRLARESRAASPIPSYSLSLAASGSLGEGTLT
jgi:hypothetical protein